MKYRLDITLIFDDLETAEKVRKMLEMFKSKAVTINRDKLNMEKSIIRLHKCYHDEENPKPCEDIFVWMSD